MLGAADPPAVGAADIVAPIAGLKGTRRSWSFGHWSNHYFRRCATCEWLAKYSKPWVSALNKEQRKPSQHELLTTLVNHRSTAVSIFAKSTTWMTCKLCAPTAPLENIYIDRESILHV